MLEDDRSRDDPRRHSPSTTGGLNARIQSLLSAVLPAAGVPAALHVDQRRYQLNHLTPSLQRLPTKSRLGRTS